MTEVYFTKKEVSQLMMTSLRSENWEVQRYRYPDGSIAEVDQKEADKFIEREISKIISQKSEVNQN